MSGEAVVTMPKVLAQGSLGLDGLEKSGCLTREGKNWFTSATDPFHDDRFDPAGFPDTDTSASVIQCITQSQEFAHPDGVAGNWDVNVVLWPQTLTQTGATSYFQKTPGVYLAGATGSLTPYHIGGLTALAGASGTELYGSATGLNEDMVTLNVPLNYMQGTSRVVAMGFEVINTTSKLNVQGECTVWRQSNPSTSHRTTAQVYNADASIQGAMSQYTMRQPPGILSDAVILEGSKTWKAADGCYVIGTLNTLDNPPLDPAPIFTVVKTTDQNETNSTDVIVGPNVNAITVTGLVEALYTLPINLGPFNLAGAYFTGLSNETTLRATVKWYIERFPTASEADLVVLTSPSPAFDPCALELYSRTMSKLPVGCKQGYNPLGEWFKGVIREVTHFATPILKTLNVVNPAFGVAGGISQKINDWASKGSPPVKKQSGPPPLPPGRNPKRLMAKTQAGQGKGGGNKKKRKK